MLGKKHEILKQKYALCIFRVQQPVSEIGVEQESEGNMEKQLLEM